MKPVIVETPYAADTFERRVLHRLYLVVAMRDSISRGEAPLASALLYAWSGVLDDDKPEERRQGIDAGLVWGSVAGCETIAYVDLGVSRGMQHGIESARKEERVVSRRSVPGWREKVRELFEHGSQQAADAEVMLEGWQERFSALLDGS